MSELRERIQSEDSLPYYVEDWGESEITFYNDRAILLDERQYSNKVIDAIKKNEGEWYDYTLNDIYVYEMANGDFIILLDESADFQSFIEMLDNEDVYYQRYPFE